MRNHAGVKVLTFDTFRAETSRIWSMHHFLLGPGDLSRTTGFRQMSDPFSSCHAGWRTSSSRINKTNPDCSFPPCPAQMVHCWGLGLAWINSQLHHHRTHTWKGSCIYQKSNSFSFYYSSENINDAWGTESKMKVCVFGMKHIHGKPQVCRQDGVKYLQHLFH